MNICFVVNGFPPQIDGVGDYTYNLANMFHSEGHIVSVICSKNNTSTKADFTIFKVVDQWNAEGVDIALSVIDDIMPDVVCLQYVAQSFNKCGLPFPMIRFMKLLKLKGIPTLTFFHELFVNYEWRLKRIVWATLMRYVTWRIAVLSSCAATSIEYYKRKILDLPCFRSANICTIPIPSNVPSRQLDDTQRNALRMTIAPNGECIVAFFGYRNIEKSLQAIRDLNRFELRYIALLIGRVQDVAEEPFIYKTGLLDISEIDIYFQVSDMILMPENVENNRGCSFKSTALAQAFKCNLPIISTQGRLTDSSLKNNENIVFVDFNDIDALLKAIVKVAFDTPFRENLITGSISVSEILTCENVYMKYMDVLHEMLQR